MAGYVYKGSGKDETTAFLDKPKPKGRRRMHNNRCRKCMWTYQSRYHLEVCRPVTLATPKKPKNRMNRCKKCGMRYRSAYHKKICKTSDSS